VLQWIEEEINLCLVVDTTNGGGRVRKKACGSLPGHFSVWVLVNPQIPIHGWLKKGDLIATVNGKTFILGQHSYNDCTSIARQLTILCIVNVFVYLHTPTSVIIVFVEEKDRGS
jgi:hypothetical protein